MHHFNWSTFVLAVCLCPAAAPAQQSNRYLEQPLPPTWGKEAPRAIPGDDTLYYEQVLPADDRWWQAFDDPTLDSLITLATDRNYSVLEALARMEQARAQMRSARGDLLPSAQLNAGWERRQSSGNTGTARSITSGYSAGVDVSWELDVFGSLRSRFKAQRELFYASREEQSAVLVSLCAQVASAYIGLRETQQELEVVNRNCRTQAAVLDITDARFRAGLVSQLDVSQARSVYYSTRASVPSLEAEINSYITQIAVLTGTYPQEMRPHLEQTGPLPDYMEPVAIGLPADLLLRRPDIRQAARQVQAQASLLGASKSDWLPQVFLKGSVGYAAHDLRDLTDRRSLTFEIAPTITWSLFNGGKSLAATRQARAELDERISSFNQTVLTAVQETDNALTSYRTSIRQIVAMREVCQQGEETLRLSVELYKQGLTPFQNVLDSLRSLLTYQNQLTQAQGYSLLQLIALYKALGGGWQ